MSSVQRGVLLLLLATCMLGAESAAAQSAARIIETGFTTEAWYQPNPACIDSDLCTGITPPASNPYGDGTMHVAVTAGEEVARSYLAVGPIGVPRGANVTGAQLIVPVDTGAIGSTQPEAAAMQVCTTTEAIDSAQGSFDEPPAAECDVAVDLTFEAEPAPTYTAELPSPASIAGQLAVGSIGFAIVPAEPDASSTWHVVFSAQDRSSPPAPPASLVLTLTAPTGTSGSDVEGTPVPRTPASEYERLPISRLGVPPAAQEPRASASGDVAQEAAAPAALATTREVPFQYPAVVLLPAALALLAFVLVRILRADVTPGRPDAIEGRT